MNAVWLKQLAPAHAWQVKTATVAPHLAAMFTHVPEQLALDAALPDEGIALPLAARQLLKLVLAGGKLALRTVSRTRDGATLITVSFGARQCVLGDEELAHGVVVAVERIMQALFDRSDFVRVLEAFAFQSSNLGTVQKIVSHMLHSTDVDKALYAMLSGLTSGQGLGFNRAVLFIYDEAKHGFVGSKAIGPSDEGEAHRIWEAIEYEDKSIDRLIEDYQHHQFDTRFQQLVQSIVLMPSDDASDEVARAQAESGPVVYESVEPRNPGLRRLGVAREFLLAAIKPHGKLMGLVYVDNLYSRAAFTAEQSKYFSFFIDQTALVWENLSLLHRVELLARYDGLTGVYNRREFESRCSEEKARALRSQSPFSLLIMDIDLFKEVNDRLGHQAGDEMLRRLGVVLRQTLRVQDILGRFGGDEFVVLLPATNREQLAQAARRIGAKAHESRIPLSIGGANWPADCDDPKLLLTAADANLYRAKRDGRGCAFLGADERVVYSPPLECVTG